MNRKGRGRAQSRLQAQLTHLPDNQGVMNCVNQDTRLRVSENYVDTFCTCEKDLKERDHARSSVSQPFLLAEPSWLRKITTDPHVHAHVQYISCPDDRYPVSDIQGVYKIMVRFQKLTRNLFLTLHGQNVHRQQRQLSEFLMRYQQFASHA